MVYDTMDAIKPFYISIVFFLIVALGAFSLLQTKINTHSFRQTLQSEHIYPEQSALLFVNSELTVADTNLTLKIDSIDARQRWIEISFYDKGEKISDQDHIYTFSVISSDYLTYVVVKLDSLFTLCDTPAMFEQCTLQVIKRIPTPDNCYGKIGVISQQGCRDIVQTGLAIFREDVALCKTISDDVIHTACLNHFR